MSAPRHRIRRLVLEVSLQDQGSAWSLQSELSRIHGQRLEGLIDRCCTEIGAQDRLHRIESLVVDVGEVHSENLERELVEKLEPLLRKALAAQIQKEDEATVLSGDDPETLSRLELVAFFAHTGNLPWWADASKPKLVDETLGLLLRSATRPLAAVVRTLARERADLTRIVLHCGDARLSALFAALAGPSATGLSERSAELDALLRAGRAVAGVAPARFRSAVWLAALRAACIEEHWNGGPVSFWRGALAHLALELGVTYGSLVTGLHENRGDKLEGRSDPLGAVVRSLHQEFRGEVPASDPVFHRHGAEEAAGLPAEAIGEARRLLRERLAELEGEGGEAERAGRAEETEAIRERLERWKMPVAALFEELRAVVPGGPAHDDPVLDAWRDLDQQAREHGPSAAETGAGFLRLLRRVLASQRLSQRALQRILGELEHAAAASLPAQSLGEARRLLQRKTSGAMAKAANEEPSLDLAYSESDEIYVENAGLVILWPFLGHAFERLELMADKQFKDRSAQHRAVGLLQFLATGDASPPEFQLPLPKVLCGLRLAELFEFDPPVTEAETEECANLLTAVIANAPILKQMSIDGFRGSFLLRKGVLSTRDGTWLLRVERAPYDVVLDKFPWGMGWVKLPWMEAPICVEW